jgi:AcrR family transcriptional regulator
MAEPTTTSHAPRGRLDKRAAILAGALTVFARDGYTRAGIDAIATEAGVSTRTIYNHFEDKARLFQTVIRDSAERVADAQLAVMDRYLHRVVDIEADLVEFARAWLAPMPDAADHFALVRQVRAEGDHVPRRAVEAWRDAGPLRVQRALADRFQRLADDGWLHLEDADLAAQHFSRLVAPPDRFKHPAPPAVTEELDGLVAAGVRAFLYGHLPRP